MKLAEVATTKKIVDDQRSETMLITDNEKQVIQRIVLEEVRNERIVYQTKKAAMREAKNNQESQHVIDELRAEFEKAYDDLLNISFETTTACEIALRGINSSIKMENEFLKELERQEDDISED